MTDYAEFVITGTPALESISFGAFAFVYAYTLELKGLSSCNDVINRYAEFEIRFIRIIHSCIFLENSSWSIWKYDKHLLYPIHLQYLWIDLPSLESIYFGYNSLIGDQTVSGGNTLIMKSIYEHVKLIWIDLTSLTSFRTVNEGAPLSYIYIVELESIAIIIVV